MLFRKNNSRCCTVIFLALLIQMIKSDKNDRIIKPRIYRIIENNGKIVLANTESQEFHKKGLMNFLKNNADLEYRVNNVLNRHETKNGGMKKRLVKLTMPHGQETPDLHFDKDFGFSFKPLVRLHKTKQLHYDSKGRRVVKTKKLDDIPNIDIIVKALESVKLESEQKDRRNDLKANVMYTKEGLHILRHITDVDHVIGSLQSDKLKKVLKKKIRKAHDKIIPTIEKLHRDTLDLVYSAYNKDATILRTVEGPAPFIEQPPNEEEPTTKHTGGFPIADGVVIPQDYDEPVQELPCAMFPHLPLWNSWTLQQQIRNEPCPPGSIQIGNVCARHVG